MISFYFCIKSKSYNSHFQFVHQSRKSINISLSIVFEIQLHSYRENSDLMFESILTEHDNMENGEEIEKISESFSQSRIHWLFWL